MNKVMLCIVLALTMLLFSSCDDEITDTSLEVIVKDNLGNPVEGASVKLYLEYSDLQNGIDQIGTTQITNTEGKAVFTGLSPVKYYWFAEKECFNNYNGAVTTAESLTEGVKNIVNCIVSQTGTIKMVSTSTNPYKVYFNGSYVFDVAGGQTFYSFYKPTGSYSIRVLQISGYLIYPTDETYSTTLSCGETVTVTFPQ